MNGQQKIWRNTWVNDLMIVQLAKGKRVTWESTQSELGEHIIMMDGIRMA